MNGDIQHHDKIISVLYRATDFRLLSLAKQVDAKMIFLDFTVDEAIYIISYTEYPESTPREYKKPQKDIDNST